MKFAKTKNRVIFILQCMILSFKSVLFCSINIIEQNEQVDRVIYKWTWEFF